MVTSEDRLIIANRCVAVHKLHIFVLIDCYYFLQEALSERNLRQSVAIAQNMATCNSIGISLCTSEAVTYFKHKVINEWNVVNIQYFIMFVLEQIWFSSNYDNN